MSKKTALYDQHLSADGKMVDFAGFSLPINYGSQIDEHQSVRTDAGMFDVSHMVVSDLSGAGSKAYLQKLLANDVAKLTEQGKALYSCMLNEAGGVIDDLIVYWMGGENYRIITNAGTRETDLAWMQKIITDFEATLTEQADLAMLAVQGKNARAKALSALPADLKADELKRFFGVQSGDWFVGRTGYTGEDGFEIVTTAENIRDLWDNLIAIGVKPCGLGARDSLRLEAGMALYGNDLDTEHTPLESGVKWSVAMKNDRDFIGKSGLIESDYKMVGLTLNGKGILRAGQTVFENNEVVGITTSGGYSPSLDKSIGFARIKKSVLGECEVQIRNKQIPASIGGLVFLKNT